jgi:hypothetical protein
LQFRLALEQWRLFHADTGTQIAIAHALMGVPALYLAIDAAVRWTNLPVPLAVQALLAVGLYIAILRWRPLGMGPVSRRTVTVTAGLLAAAWLTAAALYDTSWDGTSYHLPALLAIAGGWNPVFAPSDIIPVNLQANGLWTVEAALYAMTGSVEGAKGLNFLFVAAALLTLVPAWTELRRRSLSALELAFAYAIVANPVALGQLFTFHVDGSVYEIGIVLLSAVLLSRSAYRRAALGLTAASIILVTGAKLTGIYYGAVVPVIAALAGWKQGAFSPRLAALVLGTLALGVVAIGFRPYVINLRDYGHLVELGSGGDVHRPSAFAGLAPPAMLAASLLSRTELYPFPQLKWPGTVTRRELVSMGTPDPRIGGFGPFFALETIVAVSVAGAATAMRRGHGFADPAFAIALGLFAITAIFPEPWSARFAPFFWGVPIFFMLGAARLSALTRWGAMVVLALALINGGVALAGNLARTALGDYRMRTLLSDLAAQHDEILIVPLRYRGFQFTAAHRLAGAKIAFRIGEPEMPIGDSSLQCARVLRTDDRIRYCLGAKVIR